MRKFKFIRGIYTDENIFNSEETNECLFACDKDGEDVLFTAQNNKEFQDRFVNLSSERLSELYTIRPSQFEVYAENVNDKYSFSYKLKDKVYDGSEDFPKNIKDKVASYLSDYTVATISGEPKLILPGAEKNATSVSIVFDNGCTNKVLERDLYFKVTGKVKEFTRENAEGVMITAYKTDGDEVDYGNPVKGIFYEGRKQTKINSENRPIAPSTKTVDKSGILEIASVYNAGNDLKFVYNNEQLLDYISYTDNLAFDLYQKVDSYLTESDAKHALNESKMLKQGFVAYHTRDCPSKKCYTTTFEAVTFYSQSNCVKDVVFTDEVVNDYNFYEVNNIFAYALVGECKVEERDGTIVKGYENSFKNLYIISTNADNKQELRLIIDNDLSPSGSIDVYINKEESYNVFGNGVYEDDAKDNASYVKLLENDIQDISKYNAEIRNNKVAPLQTSEIFRQIDETSIAINATES